MLMRPKTRRRLLVLAGVLCFVALAAWAVVSQHRAEERRELAARRLAGVAAFKAGDYDAAVARLAPIADQLDAGDYPEAARALAISLARVPPSDGRHLDRARRRLAQLAAARPDDLEVQRALLAIYARAGDHADAIAVARAILGRHGEDPDALAALRDSARAAGDFEAALAAAEQFNAARPFDLAGYVATLDVMRERGLGGDALLAFASDLYKAHPADPRFEIVLAVAHQYAGDEAEAERLLREAAGRDMPDAATARAVTALLDDLGHFDESQMLLARAVRHGDPGLLRLYARRLVQNRQYAEAADALQNLPPDAAVELLGLRALARLELGQADAARDDLASLSESPRPTATAWREALEAHYAATLGLPAIAPARRADLLTRALRRDPDNALLRYWLGEAYAALEETALAVRYMEAAAAAAPAWDRPYLALAGLHLGRGRLRAAASAADAALERAWDDTDAWVEQAVVLHAAWQQMPRPDLERRLLDLTGGIQEQHPGEPRTLAIRAELLRRAGRADKVLRLLNEAAARDDLGPAAALALADVSRRAAAGLEDQLLASSDAPALLLERARLFAADGKVAAGRELLESAVEAHLAADDAADYHLALATYLETEGDPGSAARWATLADAFPDKLAVQRATVVAPAARTDRDLVRRVIARLRGLTGERGQRWRIEQARLLIDEGGRDKTRAASRLLKGVLDESPHLKEPRVLLAAALESSGEYAAAIDYLRAAFDSDPMGGGDAGAALLRLLVVAGRPGEADSLARRMAAETALDEPRRLAVAERFVAAGEPDAAVALLRDAEQMGRLGLDGRLALAGLLDRRGDLDAARDIYDALLAAPQPPARAVLAAALFQLAQDGPEAARLTLARLEGDHIRPLDRTLAEAAFDARRGAADSARGHLETARRLADRGPEMLRVARQRAEFELVAGRPAETMALAAAHPNDAALAALAREAEVARDAGAGDLPAVLRAVADRLEGGGGGDAITARREAAALLRRAEAEPGPVKDAVRAQTEAAAAALPHVLPLQAWVARLHVAAGDDAAAHHRASAALEARPTDGRAAKLAATAALRAGKWRAARRAAGLWKRSTDEGVAGDGVAADTVVAESLLAENDPDAALAVMQPHLGRLADQPRRQPQALAATARALAAVGRTEEARELVRPLADEDESWWATALDLAASAAGDAEDGRAWLAELERQATTDARRREAAFAWAGLALREPSEPLLATARERLDALPERDAEVVARLAELADRAGDLGRAETLYREALRLAPDDWRALNNLAFVLLRTAGGDEARLDEAGRMAALALRGRPGDPTFLDTAARVAAASGDAAAAEKFFNAALAADADYLDALLGLAVLKRDAGDDVAAGRLLDRLRPLLARTGRLPRHLQLELASFGLDGSGDMSSAADSLGA